LLDDAFIFVVTLFISLTMLLSDFYNIRELLVQSSQQ